MWNQYIGNLGKIENGIVAVTAYGLINNIIAVWGLQTQRTT